MRLPLPFALFLVTAACTEPDADVDTGVDSEVDSDSESDSDTDSSTPTNLLFLGDSSDVSAVVRNYLMDADITLTDASPFYEWDPATTTLDDFTTVLMFEGDDYNELLTDAGDVALAAWVESGGTLVRTEWSAYDIEGDPQTLVNAQMAVEAPEGDYEYGATWSVADPGHPLAAGLPTQWTTNEDDGCSVVQALQGASVVMTTDLCGPALTIRPISSGRSIHVNSDFAAENDATPNDETLQVLESAVRYHD